MDRPLDATHCTYSLVHLVLQAGFGAEDLVCSRGAQRFDDLCEQQEVVEEEAVQLLVALCLVQFPAVKELPRPQAVCHRVKYKLL